MARLLIGIPARNEAERIVELADRIEAGASLLGASYDSRLALAYQTSDDDTLARFMARSSRIPQVVLQSPRTRVGKGANVKLLVHQALKDGADFLLLVDADLGGYDPCNLERVLIAAEQHEHSLVLPLWSRPRGQGNTTNYLASPLVFATRRARVRQPLAGHMLLHRSLLEQLDVDALPDDYGIDITITLTALDSGASVGQVPLVAPEHPSKEGNSERVMTEVATAVLGALAKLPTIDRPDVCWPDRYWEGWEWPRNGGIEPDHVDVILQHAGSEADLEAWLELSDATDHDVAEMWCDHLADAVRKTRAPHADLGRIVNDLVCPFFVHAEHRGRHHSSVEELELYVADLGLKLAAAPARMSRVVVLAPHPDDEVLGCTSVLLEHDVIVVHVTEGVPASIVGDEALALRAARDRESRDACMELGVDVERFITLEALDQEVWCRTSDVAGELVELLPSLECDTVYAPAFQSGHPDHDGLYVAAQLARSALNQPRLQWNCYALYALDDRGRPGYGWLHPGLFPDVTDRPFSTDEIERKSRALRAFTSQVHAGSVVQSWIDAPVSERFAPMPPRDAPIPHLRSYYDEVFRFDEQGIDRGTVDRVLRDALSVS